MSSARSGQVTKLLQAMEAGDPTAADRLIPLLYDELRVLAGRLMRAERPDHTLQPTALVHEAYLRLVDQRQVQWQGRAHFLGLAARMMRRVLVDHARARATAKRGGEQVRVTLDDETLASDERGLELLALDEALERLAEEDPRAGRVVELRFFGGLTVEETAGVLETSPVTVKRDWQYARAWLSRALSEDAGPDRPGGAGGEGAANDDAADRMGGGTA